MPNLDHAPASVESLDGRKARRDRNRAAVVDALLQCYDEGMLKPSIADIAERSGVSHRSVFRYFDDRDELSRAAIAQGHERWDPLSEIREIGKGPFEVRLERVISQRLELYKAMEGPAKAARLLAPFSPVVNSDLIRWRLFLRAQLRCQFSPELKEMSEVEARTVLGAVDVLCSFESFALMRHDQNMTNEQIHETLRASLDRLFAVPGRV